MSESSVYVILPLLLGICACAVGPTFIPSKSELYSVDFRPYSDRGFLFSPGDYPGEYEAIGMVTYVIWPSARKVAMPIVNERTGGSMKTVSVWLADTIRVDQALKHAYEHTLEIGADALIQFDIKPVNRNVADTNLEGVEVSGFAIRRKDLR